MNIKIIAPGKIKDKYLKLGIDEFLKRLRPYCSIKITEIQAEEITDINLTEKVLAKEGEKILAKIKDNSCVIALDFRGKQFSSEKFAGKINEVSLSGVNEIVFVIGSSEGLSEAVKKRANLMLSFSEMTFPHQLMRLILLEQVYRAFKILNNETYHK